MAILRTLWWFIFFFGSLLFLAPSMHKAKKWKAAGDERAEALIHKKVTWWAQSLLDITGVTVTVTGRENIPANRAVVFTPNHQSNYDIPLMLTQLDCPHALVAKIETKKIPLVRTWMELLDCVFLDRENPRQAVAAMNEASKVLERGKSVIVFPEGTRSKGDAMGEFKSGAFKMAFKAKAPIVPVVIDGSYKAMEANGNLMCPAHVNIHILPSVETANLDRTAQKELPVQIAAMIAENKQKRGN